MMAVPKIMGILCVDDIFLACQDWLDIGSFTFNTKFGMDVPFLFVSKPAYMLILLI